MAFNTAAKTKIRVAGQWVDPVEWIRVAGEWVQRDTPSEPEDVLVIPRGAVSNFGQAADVYDHLGVNVHWKASAPNPYATPANIVSAVAELGARHIRDTVTGSWWSTVYVYYRNMLLLRNRINNLPTPSSTDQGHPIFQSCHTPGWTGNQPQNFGNDFSFTTDDFFDVFDAGRAHWTPALTPRAQVPDGTTSNQNAITPNPWDHDDPEADWCTVGLITSANEPNNTAIGNLKAWTKQLRDKLKLKTDVEAFGGLPVVTEAGIRENVKVSQIPSVGPSIINNGISQTVGDMSLGTDVCDLGDNHPYHVGHEPSHEKVTVDLQQTGLSFNGALASPATYTKSLPFVFTEWGHISRGIASAEQAMNDGAHAGYWPTPDAIIAEYMARMVILFWSRGIRRTYIYELFDQADEASDAENNFGLLTWNRTKKPQFYALRNLLKLIGFTEASEAGKGPIPYSVAGFVAQGMNGVGTGFNRHLGKFMGAGDFGQTGVGQVYHRTADRLDAPLIQQDDDTYIIPLVRQVSLWDREVGNWDNVANEPKSLGNVAGGTFTPNVQNITINLPNGIQTAQVAQPTLGGTATPNDGLAWTDLPITNAGKRVTPSIQGNMKLVKVTV